MVKFFLYNPYAIKATLLLGVSMLGISDVAENRFSIYLIYQFVAEYLSLKML